MVRFRNWFSIGAVFALVIALNAAIWTQNLFTSSVLIPLLIAVLLGSVRVILLILALAERQEQEGRAAWGLNAFINSVVFLGICIVIYLFLDAWNVSWDLTEEGRRALSPQTIQVLQAINTEVAVTCFFLQMDEELVAIARDKTLRFLDQCRRYTPLIKVEILDPTIDRARLEAMNITHASVQGTIVLKSGERQRVITLTGGSPRLEERDFVNALINLLRKNEPKVYFMTGHKERDIMDEDPDKGGSTLGNLLRGESYQVDRLAIKISDPEIPNDVDIIVINNPLMDFHPIEIQALDEFFDRGGRALLLLDPWRTPPSSQENLRPYFEKKFGIRIGSDIVITDQGSNRWQADLTVDNGPFEKVEEGFMEYKGAFSLKHPITRKFDQSMLLQAIRSISVIESPPDTVGAVELLRTTPDFWAETDTEKLLQTGQAKRDEGERQGPIPVAVAAVMPVDKTKSPQGNRDARAVVVGDADFASNGFITIPGHLNFLLNAFAWLSEREDLIAIRPRGREPLPLLLSPLQQRAIAWVSIMLTLQLVLCAGCIVYIVRRRHQ